MVLLWCWKYVHHVLLGITDRFTAMLAAPFSAALWTR